METIFYISGAFFFIFASSMLAGLNHTIHEILGKLDQPKKENN